MKQYVVDMNQMGVLHAEKGKWVFTEVYKEQRELRLMVMDANPESW